MEKSRKSMSPMVKLNPSDTILYDSSVVPSVNRFHKLNKNVEAYVTPSWTLVYINANDPERYLAIESSDWIPEYGDFYKTKEPPDGSSEDEQKAQGGDR